MNLPTSAHNFSELLRQHARSAPDRVAVWFPRGRSPGSDWDPIAYGELDRAADAVAAGLRAAGFLPGERAVLMLRPDRRFYPLVFGLFRAGVVPVFIDPGMGLSRALGCVGDIGPDALVAVPPVHIVSCLHRRPFRAVRRRVTAGPRLGWGGPTLDGLLATQTDTIEAAPVRPEDDCVIVFTSGATGAPKGVSLSHGTMRARVELIADLLDLRPGMVISETLLVYTILEICMGMTVAVPPMDLSKPATVDPATVLRGVARFKPQVVSASPVVWQRLVRHAATTGARLDGVRLLLTTAAPIPVDLHERLRAMVDPGVELFTPYGATEAMPVAMIGSAEILATTGALTAAGAGTCVGRLAPQADVRILRLTDAPVPTWDPALELPVGQLGEITVVSPGVSDEYREAPAANAIAKINHDGRIRHRMGDVGYLDADGRLWFCGRAAHVLHTANGPVANVPIEGVINGDPRVYRSAVVGVGPRGAEEAVCVVELEPGVPWTDGLVTELRARLSGTRWEGMVTRFLHHPALPTDPRHNSKIRNELVREWVATQPR